MGVEESLRSVALPLVRFASFAANALLFGILPIVLLVLRPAFAAVPADEWARGRRRLAERLEGMFQAALTAAAAATFVGLLLQTVLVSELRGGELSSSSLTGVVDTSFGRWYALRVPLLIALAFIVAGRVRARSLQGIGDGKSPPRPLWWGLWGGLTIALLVTVSASGHAAVATPTWLAIINDVVHLAAGGCWFSGIIILAVVLPEAWGGRGGRATVHVLAPNVSRFARVALVSIVVVAATGTLNSFFHLATPSDLVDNGYGLALVVKLGLFALILAFGGLNHFFVRRRLEGAVATGDDRRAPSLFRRTIASELALALAIMAVTGLLVGMARPRGVTSVAPAPVSETNVQVGRSAGPIPR